MKGKGKVAVAGLGAVGTPLAALLSESYDVTTFDVHHPPLDTLRPIELLHICYPFEIPDFLVTSASYIAGLEPAVTVINSTVAVVRPVNCGTVAEAGRAQPDSQARPLPRGAVAATM
jgi:hypothetical protein